MLNLIPNAVVRFCSSIPHENYTLALVSITILAAFVLFLEELAETRKALRKHAMWAAHMLDGMLIGMLCLGTLMAVSYTV